MVKYEKSNENNPGFKGSGFKGPGFKAQRLKRPVKLLQLNQKFMECEFMSERSSCLSSNCTLAPWLPLAAASTPTPLLSAEDELDTAAPQDAALRSICLPLL